MTKVLVVDDEPQTFRALRRVGTNDDTEQPIVRIGETTVDLQAHRVTREGGGESDEPTVIGSPRPSGSC
jgi:hypothetical protein